MSETKPIAQPAAHGRPDPHAVAKRPMARAQGDMVFASRRTRATATALFGPRGPELDAWYGLIDEAEAVLEGADDGVAFDGSAVLLLPVAPAEQSPAAAAIGRDPRLQAALQDRFRRELAALLGPLTPAAPTITVRAHPTATHLRVDADIEGRLPVGVDAPDEPT